MRSSDAHSHSTGEKLFYHTSIRHLRLIPDSEFLPFRKEFRTLLVKNKLSRRENSMRSSLACMMMPCRGILEKNSTSKTPLDRSPGGCHLSYTSSVLFSCWDCLWSAAMGFFLETQRSQTCSSERLSMPRGISMLTLSRSVQRNLTRWKQPCAKFALTRDIVQ